MKDYLTDLEVAKIEAFCADKDMHEAVKKVLLQHIYSQGVLTKGQKADPLRNRALVLVASGVPNDELGSHLRALWEGVNALEGGYKELETIKSEKDDSIESPYNVAE